MKEESEYSSILWDDMFGDHIRADNQLLYQFLDHYLENQKEMNSEELAEFFEVTSRSARRYASEWSKKYENIFWKHGGGQESVRGGGQESVRGGGQESVRKVNRHESNQKILWYEPQSDVRKAAIRLQQEHDLALDEVLDICQRKVESGKFDSVGEALVGGARRNGLL